VFGRGEVGPVRRAEREVRDFQLRSRFATGGRDIGGLDGWSSYARFGRRLSRREKTLFDIAPILRSYAKGRGAWR
jgi:hypothetical protein